MSSSVNLSANCFDQNMDTLQNKWLFKINQLQTVRQIKDFTYSNYRNSTGISTYDH